MASQGPEKAVRELVAAFNERDLESFIAGLDTEVELLPLLAQLEGKAYRGHDGAREMFVELDQDWEHVRIEIDELRDAGEEVVALCHLRSRGRVSGVDLDMPLAVLWRFRRGKILYLKSFSEPADALRAAGLE